MTVLSPLAFAPASATSSLMIRFRLAAVLLALMTACLPLERGAWAERSEPQYGSPSKVLKRTNRSRPRRTTRKPRASQVAPAKPGKAEGLQAPAAAPVPAPNPEREAPPVPVPSPKQEAEPAPAGDAAPPPAAPVPPEKPEAIPEAAAPAAAPVPQVAPPPVAPLPPAKPPEAKAGEDGAEEPADGDKPDAPMDIPAQPAATPAEEAACRASLTKLGVVFTEKPAEADPAGCSLPGPLLVTKLSPTVSLEPGALVNCAMAEAAARFVQGPMSEAARRSMGEDLMSIEQASAYVCRPRRGTRKLSEHAFGNAIDFARFTFAKGAALEVGPAPGEKGEAFLQSVRKAACGPFKTVLGPGSDADHATHLHLDLAHRKHGGTFCQ